MTRAPAAAVPAIHQADAGGLAGDAVSSAGRLDALVAVSPVGAATVVGPAGPVSGGGPVGGGGGSVSGGGSGGDPPDGSDAQLWERVAADPDGPGGHAAFTELFERHAEAVWNYAYRLTASWTSADDLLSAAFLTAWRTRGRVVLTGNGARPWLFAVTANLARTERRAGRRLAGLRRRLGTPVPRRDHADELAESDAAVHRLRLVLAAVDRLPRSEREIARLRLLGEVSTADAARLLGIAEASVRSRVARARTRLRALTQENPDD